MLYQQQLFIFLISNHFHFNVYSVHFAALGLLVSFHCTLHN